MSNRRTPSDFRGFDPHVPFSFYQRHLPQWRPSGTVYFVPFRQPGSVPRSVLDYVERLRLQCDLRSLQHAGKQRRKVNERKARNLFEASLDEGRSNRVIQSIGRIPLKCGHPCTDSFRRGGPVRLTIGWGSEDDHFSQVTATG